MVRIIGFNLKSSKTIYHNNYKALRESDYKSVNFSRPVMFKFQSFENNKREGKCWSRINPHIHISFIF